MIHGSLFLCIGVDTFAIFRKNKSLCQLYTYILDILCFHSIFRKSLQYFIVSSRK